MAEAGCRLDADLTQLAVMWFARVVWHLPRFWRLLSLAERRFRHRPPSAVVLIDYPGFNWWIAWRAQVHGIPVFYYGTPQVWAWASWRVRKLRRLVDHPLCHLQFEEEWYRRRGCPATFIGHPYFDDLREQQLDEGFLRQWQDGRPLVTILPGSRRQEVTTNLPAFLRTVRFVQRSAPQARFVVASYDERQAALARAILQRSDPPLDVAVCVGRTRELIRAATCCLACSGSVSLELLYEVKPTVVHYGIGRVAFVVQSLLRHARYITLVNLLAAEDPLRKGPDDYDPDQGSLPRVPFPEYLTFQDKSAHMAHHLVRWLLQPTLRQRAVASLQRLRSRVVTWGACERGADCILDVLGRQAPPIPRPHFRPGAGEHFQPTARSCAIAGGDQQ
jgi:lipid-A-disaccharide synthase